MSEYGILTGVLEEMTGAARGATVSNFHPGPSIMYSHTQRSPLVWILIAIAFLFVWIARQTAGEPFPLYVRYLLAGIYFFFAACFAHLQVRDERNALAIRYGPLPLFRKRIPYDDIASVAPARSKWLDGGGIHYIPGRGWIYNLWGFDCVSITMNDGRVVRVGTDDRDGLVKFLLSRLGL